MKTRKGSLYKKSLLGILSAVAVIAGSVMPAFAEDTAATTPVGPSGNVGSFSKAFALEATSEASTNPLYFPSPEADFYFVSGPAPTAGTEDSGEVGFAKLMYVSDSHFNTTDATGKQALSVKNSDGTVTKELKSEPSATDTPLKLKLVDSTGKENHVSYDLGAATVPASSSGKTSYGAEKNIYYIPVNDNGETKAFTYPGVYYYEFHEKQDNITGITYDDTTYTIRLNVEYKTDNTLKVTSSTVTKDEADSQGNTKTEKDKFVQNTYGAGKLTITKKIEGNIGDKEKEFTIAVTLDDPKINSNTTQIATVYLTGNYVPADETGKITGLTYTKPSTSDMVTDHYVKWQDGETKYFLVTDKTNYSLYNIPNGVTYTVYEYGQNKDTTDENIDVYRVNGYAVAYSGTISNNSGDTPKTTDIEARSDDNKLIVSNEVETGDLHEITITNSRDVQLDTGVFTSNLPYFIILFAAAGGLVIFLVSRKHHV